MATLNPLLLGAVGRDAWRRGRARRLARARSRQLIGVAHAPLEPDAVVRTARDVVFAGRQVHADAAVLRECALEGLFRSPVLGRFGQGRRDERRAEDCRRDRNTHGAPSSLKWRT